MKVLNHFTLRQALLICIPSITTICWCLLVLTLFDNYWRYATRIYSEYQSNLFDSFIKANALTVKVRDYNELRRQLSAATFGPDRKHVAIIDDSELFVYADMAHANAFDSLWKQWSASQQQQNTGSASVEDFRVGSGYFVFTHPILYQYDDKPLGKLVAFVSDARFRAQRSKAIWMFVVIATAFLTLQTLIVVILSRKIVAPLERFVSKWTDKKSATDIQSAMKSGDGDYTKELLVLSRTLGEIFARQATAAAVGRLTTQLAHDMRSPLSVIQSYVKFDGEEEDKITLAAAAAKSTAKLLSMAEELLDYSKAARITKAPVDITKAVSMAVEEVRAATPSGITITRAGASQLVVPCDADKITRVITNILVNATQAMANKEGKINLCVEGGDQSAVLYIADNGCGIREEHLPKIFDPSFTFGKKKGTGLGLDYCKTVVEAHGGKILVESTIGKGTTFTIMLPLQMCPDNQGTTTDTH